MVLDPIAQIDLATIGAVVAIFLVTFALLRRVCFLPLLAAMEARAVRIDTAHARRAEAEARLAEARLQAEGLLERARAEALRIAGAAREERARGREARIAQASAEADAALARGHDEVVALRQSQQARLAEELCASVGQVLARMIGPVDERMVRFLVSRALAARETR